MRLPDLAPLVRSRLVVAFALILATGAAGLGVSGLLGDDALPRADTGTTELVRDFAIAVTSFDHRTAEQDVAEVLAFGTRDFEAEFRSAMGEDFLPGVQASQSVSVGRILAGPTLQSRVDGTSTLLVVVNQTISSGVAVSADGGAGSDTSTTAASDATPSTSSTAPRVVRVGMLVTVDDESSKISSVQIL